jgi:hypothetical protein
MTTTFPPPEPLPADPPAPAPAVEQEPAGAAPALAASGSDSTAEVAAAAVALLTAVPPPPPVPILTAEEAAARQAAIAADNTAAAGAESSSSSAATAIEAAMPPWLHDFLRSQHEMPAGVSLPEGTNFSTVSGQGQVLGHHVSDANSSSGPGSSIFEEPDFANESIVSMFGAPAPSPLPVSVPPSAASVALAPAPAPVALPPQQQQQQQPRGVWEEYGMSRTVYDHFLSIFLAYDTNGDRRLSETELCRLVTDLNFVHKAEDARRIYLQMSGNGASGQLGVSQHDFLSWLASHRPDPSALAGMSIQDYNTLILAFRELDDGRRGTLDRARFTRLAMKFKLANTFKACEELFTRLDASNRDGRVSLADILGFVKYRNEYAARYGAFPQPAPQPPTPAVAPQQPQQFRVAPGFAQPPPPPMQQQQYYYQQQYYAAQQQQQYQQQQQFRTAAWPQTAAAPPARPPAKEKDDCVLQ